MTCKSSVLRYSKSAANYTYTRATEEFSVTILEKYTGVVTCDGHVRYVALLQNDSRNIDGCA